MSKYFKYAIGEILLVVIGILIALQVNDWNENRKQAAKEKALLTAIHTEFLKNRIQLDTVLSYHNNAKKSCERLVSMFPIDIKTSNLDTIGKHVYNILFHYTFNPSQGTLNGIINTSSLDVISNYELREIIASWKDMLSDFTEDELVGKWIVQNQLDPIFAKHFDFNFNFKDKRSNPEFLETLEFEYYVKLRLMSLEDILDNYEYETLNHALERIIDLTSSQKH